MIDKSTDWQSALQTIADMKKGTVITHKEMDELLRISMPSESEYDSIMSYMSDFHKYQMIRLTLVSKLTDDLLKQHRVFLRNVRRVGYMIVLPGQQAPMAYDNMIEEMKSSAAKANMIATNVSRSHLTDEEIIRDRDIRAKIVNIGNLVLNCE